MMILNVADGRDGFRARSRCRFLEGFAFGAVEIERLSEAQYRLAIWCAARPTFERSNGGEAYPGTFGQKAL